MQARATFGGTELAGGALRTLIVAILIALTVGGAGGYIFRALTSSVTSSSANEIHRPFVVEQPPYQPTASQGQCRWTGTPPQLSC